MTRSEIERLALALADHNCTPEEFARLDAELHQSTEARRIFRDTFVLEGMLGTYANGELDLPAEPRPFEPPDHVLAIPSRSRATGRRAWAWGLAAAAVVLMSSAGLYLRWRPVPGIGLLVSAPNSELTVAGRTWAKPSPLTLHQGDRVRLAAGVVQVNLTNGVSGIISGPAEFAFDDDMRLKLEDGVGRFHVSSNAVGFCIEAGNLEVVDLGTTFGVARNRDPSVLPQVHVFQGKVQVRTGGDRAQRRVVKSGQAVSVSSDGRVRVFRASSRMFYESLPDDLPYVHIPFERDGDRLLLLGTYPGLSEISLKLPRFGVRLVPGIAGLAARFDSSNHPIYSDWTGVLGDNPRTVCAWIRHPAGLGYRQYQSIIGWGDPTIGSAAKSEMLLYRPGRESRTFLRFSFDQFLYTGTTPLDDGQWHHVAAVFRGPGFSPRDAVAIYVDGEPENLSSEHSNLPADRPPPSTQPRLQPVLIGCTPLPDPDRGYRGDIDEIYVFEAPLKPHRIRDLASDR